MKTIIKAIYKPVLVALFVLYLITQLTITQRRVNQLNKTQQVLVEQLKQQKAAEVQCTVELNIKNNKNGVVVLDANQTAAKLGEEVKKALKNK